MRAWLPLPVRLAASVLDQTMFGPNTIAKLLYVILMQCEVAACLQMHPLLVHLRLLCHLTQEVYYVSQQGQIALRQSAQHGAHKLLLLVNRFPCGM